MSQSFVRVGFRCVRSAFRTSAHQSPVIVIVNCTNQLDPLTDRQRWSWLLYVECHAGMLPRRHGMASRSWPSTLRASSRSAMRVVTVNWFKWPYRGARWHTVNGQCRSVLVVRLDGQCPAARRTMTSWSRSHHDDVQSVVQRRWLLGGVIRQHWTVDATSIRALQSHTQHCLITIGAQSRKRRKVILKAHHSSVMICLSTA